MFTLGQNWAELKQDYCVGVFPSVSIFLREKMGENYKYSEKKVMVAKVKNSKYRGEAGYISSSLLLLFLKPNNACIPNC